jgi:hypothetical protein
LHPRGKSAAGCCAAQRGVAHGLRDAKLTANSLSNKAFFTQMRTNQGQQELRSAIQVLQKDLSDRMKLVEQTKAILSSLYMYIGDEEPVFLTGLPSKTARYEGKRVATAVKDYLGKRGTAATVDEIFAALKGGGFRFGSAGSKKGEGRQWLLESLRKNTRAFQRTSDGSFGLTLWYRRKKDIRPSGNTSGNT